MTRGAADFDLLAMIELRRLAMVEFLTANFEAVAALYLAEPPEAAKLKEALLRAAFLHAEDVARSRAGGTYIYGRRALKNMQRAARVGEALQVRPALSMVEVARHAGVSRAALYRIMKRKKQHG